MPTPLTLIQLISEQTMQNVLPILALQPATVISILSQETSRFAQAVENITSAVQLACQRGLIAAVPVFPKPVVIGANSPRVKEAREVVARIYRDHPAAVLNYTGGTKDMSIGAWLAATDAGAGGVYCDTPREFRSELAREVTFPLTLPELARKLPAELILAAHGLFAQRDYHFTKDRNAISRLGEAAFELYERKPELLRQFRSAWRRFCTEGRNNPSAADVRRVEGQGIPMAREPALAAFFDCAVRCGFLDNKGNRLQVNFAGRVNAAEKRLWLERVLTELEGGVFEAVVLHKLKTSRRFTSFLRGVRPAGDSETADFGESDFVAYSPETVSLTLISCKTSPPKLEHLESLLTRKAKFGGRFAGTLLCMEHEGMAYTASEVQRASRRADKLQQLELLGMKGAFADQLDEIFKA